MKKLISALAIAVLALSFTTESNAQMNNAGMTKSKALKKTSAPRLPRCTRMRMAQGTPCA
jgi:hypothetical protein